MIWKAVELQTTHQQQYHLITGDNRKTRYMYYDLKWFRCPSIGTNSAVQLKNSIIEAHKRRVGRTNYCCLLGVLQNTGVNSTLIALEVGSLGH